METKTLQAQDLRMEARNLSVYYGPNPGVQKVNLPIHNQRITALIGPSGCGKTTFLRALNRMHDLTPGARVEGEVLLDGQNIYAPGVDPVEVRRRVGMVFQKPNPFPTLSIYDNVAAGLKLAGVRKRSLLDEAGGRALQQAAPLDEGENPLRGPAISPPGGEAQRACIARAPAREPEGPLMDGPTRQAGKP